MSNAGENNFFRSLYDELKQRRVMRVATLYVFLFWPIIQVADILSPAMDLPPQAMRYLLILFVIGLPIAMLLSWLFDLNRSGIVRTGERAAGDVTVASQPLVGRGVERSVIGVLLLVIAVLFYYQYAAQLDDVSEARPAESAVRALAVLPFVSFSEQREDQFFSDGLTEELLNALSKLQNLRVIARTTSFAYKGVNKNVQDIGFELEVDAILEGSVRRNDIDDTIRVTAQLIDVESGAHVWSQTFDREYRDVFKIQDEIAAAVADQLQVTLLAGGRGQIRSADMASPEALVVLSMGRAELAKRTRQSFADALRFFSRAVELAPDLADAHAELGKTHALMYSYGDVSGDHLLNAERAVAQALELDADSADAWAASGLIQLQRDDKKAAAAALAKAISLNSSHAMAQMWMGELQEDPAQRLAYHQRAYELDPRSAVAAWNVANDLFEAGRDADAMDIFDRIIQADPYYPQAYELAARIDESHGRLAAAIPNYEKAMELNPQGHIAMRLAHLYVDIGDFANADLWIEAAARAGADETGLQWLRISAFTARGDRAQAELHLTRMLEVPAPGAAAYANAALAAYFLAQPQRVVEAWRQIEQLQGDEALVLRNNPEAFIAAAHAFSQLGAEVQATAVLDLVDGWLDQKMNAAGRRSADLWYFKAQVVSIRGENNLALLTLQRAIDEGWRQHWRPAAEPSLQQLQKIETFQSMMAGLAARMDLMGEQLEFDGFFAAAAGSRRG